MSDESKIDVEFKLSLISTEAVAKAWASIDGRLEGFEECKNNPEADEIDGHYSGYLSDAEELLRRANKYQNSPVDN